MEILVDLQKVFLIVIRLGAVMRVIYCFIYMSIDEENEKSYKKKLVNVIIFYVLAESCFSIKDLMMGYYM